MKRRPNAPSLIVAVGFAATAMACAGERRTGASPPTVDEGERSAGAERQPPREDNGEAIKNVKEDAHVKIKLLIDGKALEATMEDHAAARDFLALLPLALTLRDYAGTEKISDLPTRVSTAGTPAGVDPDVGDITYYAPWGNLAIFYRDFGYSNGLVRLGHLESGIEALAKQRGELAVRIERAD